MINKNRSEDIKAWREALIQLDDLKFFELMRLYLGKIETPFNKQKLLEKLSAFLRRPTIKEKIIMGLDAFDIAILTAITYLPITTEDILHAFFKEDYSYSVLYGRLANLEERLVVYKKTTQLNGLVYKTNPYLASEILKIANVDIFSLPEHLGEEKHASLLIDNIKIAGLYSFLIHNKNILKINGEIKKKDLKKINNIFPDFLSNTNAINYLIYAFLNLGLFMRTETGLIPNKKKWDVFCKLNPYEMKSYLTIAASGKYQNAFLHSKADAFYKFINSLNSKAEYRKEDLKKAFFICIENIKIGLIKTETNVIFDINESDLVKTKTINVIDIAIMFGILCKKNGLLAVNSSFLNDDNFTTDNMLISPSFEVTTFPSAKLSTLLPLLPAMEPISIQTTGRFEITRAACRLCFQKNLNAEKLCEILKTESNNNLPQNVEVSIMQWFKSFSAIKLYTGVVAIVSSEKQNAFENASSLSDIIHQKIGDGVYLLKDNPYEQIKAAKFEFLLNEPKKIEPFSYTKFPPITAYAKKEKNLSTKAEWQKILKNNQKKYFSNFEELKNKLTELNLSQDEKQAMLEAIKRHVIIDKTQIKKENIQNRKIEISGLDFLGKIRICDKAINEHAMLELSISAEGTLKTILCTPMKILRAEKNAFLTAILEPEKRTEQISVAHILKIKVIKNSIFY